MNYTFENFISYCDDMMIAEESAHTINKKYIQLEKDLENIKTQLKSENDVNKILALLQKQKLLIQQVKSQVLSEQSFGFVDVFTMLKKSIIPLIIASMTICVAKSKDRKLSDSS